tara:strand:+ start:730 stop:1059 length:330 start_codon:yes stop_codon:yes gene_type:complete
MLVFGWAGGVINCLHVLPQMIKIYKTKSVEDISCESFFIKFVACALYTIHGALIWDMPLLCMTAVVLVQYGIILIQYKYYYKAKKCGANIVASTHHTIPQTCTENGDHA